MQEYSDESHNSFALPARCGKHFVNRFSYLAETRCAAEGFDSADPIAGDRTLVRISGTEVGHPAFQMPYSDI